MFDSHPRCGSVDDCVLEAHKGKHQTAHVVEGERNFIGVDEGVDSVGRGRNLERLFNDLPWGKGKGSREGASQTYPRNKQRDEEQNRAFQITQCSRINLHRHVVLFSPHALRSRRQRAVEAPFNGDTVRLEALSRDVQLLSTGVIVAMGLAQPTMIAWNWLAGDVNLGDFEAGERVLDKDEACGGGGVECTELLPFFEEISAART